MFGDTLRKGKPQTLGFFGGLSPKNPKFQGLGQGHNFQNAQGHFGDRETLKFGFFWGENPQKSPNFGVGMGDRISGIFPTLHERLRGKLIRVALI